MDKILLEPAAAAVRAAEKQAAVLQELYQSEDAVQGMALSPTFVAARRASLSALRQTLRDELARRDLLPGTPNPEAVDLACLIERLRGLVKDEPREVAIAEESKLLEQCDVIGEEDTTLADAIASQHKACREAIDYLKRND